MESSSILGFQTLGTTQQRCFICKSSEGRSRVPKSACLALFQLKRIYIPQDKVRCCRQHLEGCYFTEEATELIEGTQNSLQFTGKQLTQ